MMRMTDTVKQLLIINIIFYIGSNYVGDIAYQLFSEFYPENPNFRIWQPVTAMFMHAPVYNQENSAAIMHLVFNMFALVSFGSALEQFWGAKKFIFFYISCGLGAALLHTGFNYYQYQQALELFQEANIPQAQINAFLTTGDYNSFRDLMPLSTIEQLFFSFNTPSLGASGAIYGLLTAFAFMFPNAELGIMFIPIPIKAKYFVPGLIAVDLFLGFKGSSIFGSGGTGIAHFAHIGGAITGFVMMWYWKKNSFNKNRWN
ncbi:rhomboid family intramembrane serine protease [Flavobacterium sp. J49]|uniref:rhomboid family intramembrane serine protease n=1 Tax=Flavobacterium sp. J49 TaxID=2718534 RepID=UPI001592C0CC|nr:rhomboid family intramembrane serine protease [Flavobacterium sp. J49]MBF6642455.1 rhomboid family intramembrane serine protease [Flavobacterium sp. J49]NIC03701.1 rhomboid family intramembrane serine protease [Flavobacterium sp. J49]